MSLTLSERIFKNFQLNGASWQTFKHFSAFIVLKSGIFCLIFYHVAAFDWKILKIGSVSVSDLIKTFPLLTGMFACLYPSHNPLIRVSCAVSVEIFSSLFVYSRVSLTHPIPSENFSASFKSILQVATAIWYSQVVVQIFQCVGSWTLFLKNYEIFCSTKPIIKIVHLALD